MDGFWDLDLVSGFLVEGLSFNFPIRGCTSLDVVVSDGWVVICGGSPGKCYRGYNGLKFWLSSLSRFGSWLWIIQEHWTGLGLLYGFLSGLGYGHLEWLCLVGQLAVLLAKGNMDVWMGTQFVVWTLLRALCVSRWLLWDTRISTRHTSTLVH